MLLNSQSLILAFDSLKSDMVLRFLIEKFSSEINIKEILIVFITSILISIFSTIFPAIRSAKVDPIKTIRNE